MRMAADEDDLDRSEGKGERMPLLSLPRQRRNRLLLWLALAVLVILLLWVARGVLLPYILGLVMAYFLMPLVNWLDRHMPARLRRWHISRALAIVLTYVLLLAILAGLVAFVVPMLTQQIDYLVANWPSLVDRAQGWGRQGWNWYQTLPETWRATIETNLKGLLGDVMTTVQNGVVSTVRTVFGTVSFIIGLVVVPFWVFYILHDESKVNKGVIGVFPERVRADLVAIARLVDDVLSAYIRGQFLLMLFVGGMAMIACFIIGVPFAVVLGLIAGLLEVLPYVGPILGAIPATLVALLASPSKALWLVIAFIAIQQVENLVLVPRVAGKSVKLHPALVMVVLVIGNELGGFVGMIMAVPAAAIIRDLFKYLYLRLLDEPLSPGQAAARVRTGKKVRMDL
jgi:predicted PurR-regulated permease PerM